MSGLQLLLLVKTLPADQDAMEAELASYAEQAMRAEPQANNRRTESTDSDTIISIDERRLAFDNVAAQQTLEYMREGFKEIREEFNPFHCGTAETSSDEEDMPQPTEGTPLLMV